MTLREVAEQAIQIHQAHDEAASADAGFDAGEFSGPAHGRMADEEIKALAEENGFTYEQVNQEIERICHEGDQDDIDMDVQTEVCVRCGVYFDYKGGWQLCPTCRRL